MNNDVAGYLATDFSGVAPTLASWLRPAGPQPVSATPAAGPAADLSLSPLPRAWSAQSPVLTPVSALKVDPAFQPRSEAPLAYRDRGRWAETSAAHVSLLRSRLAAGSTTELDPILVARLPEGLYVVDGHHRLRAYRLAGRDHIPSRLLDVTREGAVMVSKLVNFGSEKLPMLRQQAAEACWQYLALVTVRGRLRPPSTRAMAAQFGISHQTVATMCRRLPDVDPAEYAAAACDPGTGWPLWKHARGNSFRVEESLSPDKLLLHRGEKLAKRLAALLDKSEPRVVSVAVRLLVADAADPDRKALIEELALYASDDDLDPF